MTRVNQAYFGEHNFVFVNDDKVKVFAVLQDSSEVDMQIYHHLDDYLEEVNSRKFLKKVSCKFENARF